MLRAGATEAEVYARFHAIGINGLYVDDQPELLDFQRPYARTRAEVDAWDVDHPDHITLAEVVREGAADDPDRHLDPGRRVHPGDRHATMATYCARPIIMPLSNPTSRAEATPADVLRWTERPGTGRHGQPVRRRSTTASVRHGIAQANNALIFPGLGLGGGRWRGPPGSPTGMIAAAADALAGLVNAYRPGAALLPSISDLRMVSATVAVAVAKAAAVDGVAGRPLDDPIQQVYARMWQPDYPEIEPI